MVAYREPTSTEWAAEEARLLRIRGERVLAQEAAAKAEDQQRGELIERHRADPNATRIEFETGTPRLTDQQVAEATAAYRAQYASCDEELAKLMEARLVAALCADGYKVPPMPAKDRLRELKARQLR
ncbi:MAG: hypothetical protein WA709_23585 [Stellaceae bacterium]